MNGNLGHTRKLQLLIVIAATSGAILSSVFSLNRGVYEVFPFLYILPIILVVYFFPRFGVPFTFGISLTYIGLVYYYGSDRPGFIAVSIAWSAIFIVIGVVASSYANRLRSEAKKIRKVFENAQDGIFCFDLRTKQLKEINPACARMLRSNREELIGKDISAIWPNSTQLDDFLSRISEDTTSCQLDTVLKAGDGTLCRCLISTVLSTHNLVLCSVIDLSDQRIADEEIHHTLEDLEQQVRERTAHLEKINEELKEEILERRRFERAILSGDHNNRKEREGP